MSRRKNENVLRPALRTATTIIMILARMLLPWVLEYSVGYVI